MTEIGKKKETVKQPDTINSPSSGVINTSGDQVIILIPESNKEIERDWTMLGQQLDRGDIKAVRYVQQPTRTAQVTERQQQAGESAETAAVAEQREHAGQAVGGEVADTKFVAEQKSGLEYQLNEAKVHAKELREQMEQIGSVELRDGADFVVTITEQTCGFLLRRAEALLDEGGEARLRDAHCMLVAAETAIQTAEDFAKSFNEVMADKGDKASALGGKLRRLVQNLKGGKLHLWNLIANVLTPREVMVKGGVDINHLMNAGVEIRFGRQ